MNPQEDLGWGLQPLGGKLDDISVIIARIQLPKMSEEPGCVDAEAAGVRGFAREEELKLCPGWRPVFGRFRRSRRQQVRELRGGGGY
jgi:hypothetical protein